MCSWWENRKSILEGTLGAWKSERQCYLFPGSWKWFRVDYEHSMLNTLLGIINKQLYVSGYIKNLMESIFSPGNFLSDKSTFWNSSSCANWKGAARQYYTLCRALHQKFRSSKGIYTDCLWAFQLNVELAFYWYSKSDCQWSLKASQKDFLTQHAIYSENIVH